MPTTTRPSRRSPPPPGRGRHCSCLPWGGCIWQCPIGTRKARRSASMRCHSTSPRRIPGVAHAGLVQKASQEIHTMPIVSPRCTQSLLVLVLVCLLAPAGAQAPAGSAAPPPAGPHEEEEPTGLMQFPLGTATPSEICGACHKAIYREFATGFGSDLEYKAIVYQAATGTPLTLPAHVSTTATLHALAGVDPFPVHARTVEEEGRACNVCHFPQAFALPDIEAPAIPKPQGRPQEHERGGLTCASCHLTRDGTIRGPHNVRAPHATVADPRIQ